MNDDAATRAPRAAVALRAMAAADLAALRDLVVRMSWPHRLADCELLLALGRGVVAADAADRVLGVGMWWGFGREVGTIGMVLVAPEHQGRGVGRALMAALLGEAGPRALMLYATQAGLELYQRLGFARVGQVRQHQARFDGPLTGLTGPAAPIRAARTSDHDALCALDAAAFGADRSALIRRLAAQSAAWVVDSGRGPTGFALLREFGRGRIIGPVIAADEDDAIALIAAAASAAPQGVLRVDIPAHAQRLGAWLDAAGLPAIDTVTTMQRGVWPAARGVQRFGLALQALG